MDQISNIIFWLKKELSYGTNEKWGSFILKEKLTSNLLYMIQDAFPYLMPELKLKLLFTFLEIPKRIVTSMQIQLHTFLNQAQHDPNPWVRIVATIMKDYPITFVLIKKPGGLTIPKSMYISIFTELRAEISNYCTMIPFPFDYIMNTMNHDVQEQSKLKNLENHNNNAESQENQNSLQTEAVPLKDETSSPEKTESQPQIVEPQSPSTLETAEITSDDSKPKKVKSLQLRLKLKSFSKGVPPSRKPGNATKFLDLCEQPKINFAELELLRKIEEQKLLDSPKHTSTRRHKRKAIRKKTPSSTAVKQEKVLEEDDNLTIVGKLTLKEIREKSLLNRARKYAKKKKI